MIAVLPGLAREEEKAMSLSTTPTVEQLHVLRKLGRIYDLNEQVHRLLTQLRESHTLLEFTSEKLLTDNDDRLVHFTNADAAAIGGLLEQLREELRHVNLDTYSVGEAIATSSRLDEHVDKARTALEGELLPAAEDG
jgi:hypothetical protein